MQHRSTSRDGMTLAELMVAVAITAFVVAGLCAVFTTQMKQYRQLRDGTEMRQNTQSAIQMVVRDLRMAGYGLPVRRFQISSWVTWVSGITNYVTVVQGAGSAPDRLNIVGAFGPPAATLAAATARGATALTLGTGQGAAFNTSTRKLIFIGREEVARITGISGDVLTISTHVSINGRGCKYAYADGTPIELVQVHTYGCNTNFTTALRRPFLYRNDNRGIVTNQLQQMTTLGIDDFQHTVTSNAVNITMSGVASRKELGYQHPVKRDSYRRVTQTGTATPRNKTN